MAFPAFLTGLLTVCGLFAVVAAAVAVRRFATRPKPAPRHYGPVTVLKPLYGDEALLEEALTSLCRQVYPAIQIVFGVQAADDAALPVVRRIQRLFPAVDITVVADPALHGSNRKISNLINMLPAAKHEILVLSDSDLHVAPDYLQRIVSALEQPGVGLVTTLCGGLPTAPGLTARLGATGISHSFLPSALLSRGMGRQDGLGATMALQKATLTRIGGLRSLVNHLADDNVMAQRVKQLGLTIGLADTVPVMAVPEHAFSALWQHELRWARTIRALAPGLFAGSAVQFPLFWALSTVVLSGASWWAVALFAVAWAVRVWAARSTDQALFPGRPSGHVPAWLLPVRDIVSVAQVAASYLGGQVVWRGHVMQADNGCASPQGNAVPATPRNYRVSKAAIP